MLRKLGSSTWAMMEYGCYPALLLIATPWFLRELGSARYGEWMLLNAAIGVGGILNSGTGAATIKAVSSDAASHGNEHGGEAIRASLAIALAGGSLLAVLLLCSFFLVGPTWLGRMGDPSLLHQTGIFAAILIFIEQLDNVFSSALKGAENFGVAARLEIGSKIVQVVLGAGVLVISPSLLALYGTLVFVAVARLTLKSVVCTRLLHLQSIAPSFSGLYDVLHFAKWGWAQGIGGTLFSVADRLLVGSLLGAASLAYYSIASQLAMQIHAVAAAALSVVFPKISRKIGRKENFSLPRMVRLTMFGALLFSSILAAILLLFGHDVLTLWIPSRAVGPTWQVLPLLVLAYWLLAINVVPYFVLLALGRPRFVGLSVLTAGVIGATCMFFSVRAFGFIGAPTGRVLYALVSLVLVGPLLPMLLGTKAENR